MGFSSPPGRRSPAPSPIRKFSTSTARRRSEGRRNQKRTRPRTPGQPERAKGTSSLPNRHAGETGALGSPGREAAAGTWVRRRMRPSHGGRSWFSGQVSWVEEDARSKHKGGAPGSGYGFSAGSQTQGTAGSRGRPGHTSAGRPPRGRSPGYWPGSPARPGHRPSPRPARPGPRAQRRGQLAELLGQPEERGRVAARRVLGTVHL